MTGKNKQKGFTLVEVLVVTGLLAFVFAGLIGVYLDSALLVAMAGNKSKAMHDAMGKVEEIKNYNYDDIAADYGPSGIVGDSFDLTDLTGQGKVYINDINPELLGVEVVITYRDKNGRIIGEDADFDGNLDGSEDVNLNGQLDSPISLSTFVTRR